jgi:hypothetical protein
MKTKMKLLRYICLAFLISFLALPLHSLAASDKVTSDVSITIGDAKGAAGEVVDVPVKINEAKKDIAAYGIEINYDNELLEVVGITPGYGSVADATCSSEKEGCFWSNSSNADGFLRAAWADPSGGDHPIKQATNLFTVKVKIKKTDFIGEKTLTVSSHDAEALSFTDPSGKPLTVDEEDGKLNIVESDKSPSTDVPGGDKETDTNTDSKTDSGTDTKTKTNTNTGTHTGSGLLPKTGDDSYIDTYLNIGIAVIVTLLVIMWIYKKRQKTEKTN